MKKHANVAIFIPHEGCPGQCSFCNQHTVFKGAPPSPLTTAKIAEDAITMLKTPAQIAFFGGSFTRLNRVYMEELLQSVQTYLDNGSYSGIRISTRPDAIDEDILKVLKKYRVTDIEIGAQSMDDAVLEANLRGHTADETAYAAHLIKKHGFHLGIQMMTGLYKDNDTKTIDTANTLITLNPDYTRIFPAIVVKGTKLQEWYENGIYKPQTLDEAVDLCACLLELFTDAKIPVIKLGLHDAPDFKSNIVAGPYHSAFRELCESRVLLKKAVSDIKEKNIPKGKILLNINNQAASKMIGQKRENISKLSGMGYDANVVLDDKYGYLQVEVSC
ncbi:MAG: radical SAM protein [Oscillospiraceae bacterium]|nr:radical SAM protein [Oscillospiraceae bacterium]